MALSWDLIRSFRAVAQGGSLSAAARRLRIKQPTVGRHVDLLEDALRVPLFRRGPKGMELTDRGADLVDAAARMDEGANDFQRLAAGLETGLAGPVRISANDIFGVYLLPGLLAPLMVDIPELEVEIVVSNAAANLLQRDADIAVRMFRPKQNDLVARKVGSLPLGLFGASAYLNRAGRPERLSDLREHSFIGFDRDTSLIDAAAALGLVLRRDDFAFRSDNLLTQIEAIRAGVGIGVTHVGLAANWPEVEPVLVDQPLPPLELWLACHADVQHNRRVRLVMDHLAVGLKNPYAMPEK